MRKLTFPREIIETAAHEARMELREDYSGRFMHGAECFGIVGSMHNLMSFGPALLAGMLMNEKDDEYKKSTLDEARLQIGRLIDRMHTDNMGMDWIFYFPDVELVD